MTLQLPADIALLPRRASEERLLFIIMTVMSFLAALTLLLTLAGVSASQKWQSDLNRNVTVQILAENGEDHDSLVDQAMQAIQTAAPSAKINRMSNAQSRDLLRPWLGERALIEDLPVPIILTVRGRRSEVLDSPAIKAALDVTGLETDVDDHSRWSDNIRRTWQAVKAGMIGIIVIVLSASAAVAAYATQSVLKARETILRVLSHVGAPDRFIVGLFARRFFSLGLAAAMAGALGALLFLILLFGITAPFAADILPLLFIGPVDIAGLAALVIALGVISAGVAILTSVRWLKRERRVL